MTTIMQAPPIQALESAHWEKLKADWKTLQNQNPKQRIRDGAEQLNVSEAELLCTGLGENVIRLKPDFPRILADLQSAGEVMALSRNQQVVHEKHGVYQNFSVRGNGMMGLCLGEIDLRVFFGEWKYAFAVEESARSGRRHSLQFFDREGVAIHKIYQTEKTDSLAWEMIVARYTELDQSKGIATVILPTPEYPNDGKVANAQVIERWESLKDVHQFHGMLKKLGISRLESLRLVGTQYAVQLPGKSLEQALKLATEFEIPIMLFVHNRGIVQIHTGQLKHLLRTGQWFNVLDPDFNLHANTDAISACWLVRRPSVDGTITSLEIYNHDNELILTLFGARKPGQPELASWKTLTEELETSI